MPRKIDTKGEIADPRSKAEDVGSPAPPFSIEIPLWRYGRIKFESRSQKASLALATLLLLLVFLMLLSGIEALPGAHPGVSAFIERMSQALMLVLGVLLGIDWKGGSRDDAS